jgi:hypothetical protein
MHLFSVQLTASMHHARHAEGTVMPAICMVDRRDHDEAMGLAVARFGELGWGKAEFKSFVLLPDDPDLSRFTDVMRQAYRDAKRLIVSLIEYPSPHQQAGAPSQASPPR